MWPPPWSDSNARRPRGAPPRASSLPLPPPPLQCSLTASAPGLDADGGAGRRTAPRRRHQRAGRVGTAQRRGQPTRRRPAPRPACQPSSNAYITKRIEHSPQGGVGGGRRGRACRGRWLSRRARGQRRANYFTAAPEHGVVRPPRPRLAVSSQYSIAPMGSYPTTSGGHATRSHPRVVDSAAAFDFIIKTRATRVLTYRI